MNDLELQRVTRIALDQAPRQPQVVEPPPARRPHSTLYFVAGILAAGVAALLAYVPQNYLV